MLEYKDISVKEIVRLKPFTLRDKPYHWTSDMLKLAGKLCMIKMKYMYDDEPYERIRLKLIEDDSTIPYFFTVDDISKANNKHD